MKTIAIMAALSCVAFSTHAAVTQFRPADIEAARRAPTTLPGPVPNIDSQLTTPSEPADKARLVATRKTFIVTALYDGVPFRVMDVVVDSEGLAYSTSQQSFKDPDGDELRIHVSSFAPIAADVTVVKASTHERATRDRVAFGDVPQGGCAMALRDGHFAVSVERQSDEVDLRAQSIIEDRAIHFHAGS